jgi:hypothetical protein
VRERILTMGRYNLRATSVISLENAVIVEQNEKNGTIWTLFDTKIYKNEF